MLWWIVDNYIVILLALAAITGLLGSIWWSNRKTPFLLATLTGFTLMVIVVALSIFIVTDSKRLAMNVEAIRDAFNAGKQQEMFRFFADEVTVDAMGGKRTFPKVLGPAYIEQNKQAYTVKSVETGSVNVEELERPKAKTSFLIETDRGERGRCIFGWTLGADGQWRVSYLHIEALVGGQTMPALILPHMP